MALEEAKKGQTEKTNERIKEATKQLAQNSEYLGARVRSDYLYTSTRREIAD